MLTRARGAAADLGAHGAAMANTGLGHIKIFADGADLETILELARQPDIKGFTTNPTLMHRSGIADYENFAHHLLEQVTDRPISFEVLADEQGEMIRQARLIASWGRNVYVKVPVTDTRGISTTPVLRKLVASGVHLNVTALMTLAQVEVASAALADGPPAIISVFAGRIADTGRDPIPLMKAALESIAQYPEIELLWASSREILNARQAEDIGVHIITLTVDLLNKLATFGRDLEELSLATVRMFYAAGITAGYRI